ALTSSAEENCLLKAQAKCEEKPVRFIKTIRLTVESASVLLDSYPCTKLIYMVRDPRGSYHSKTKIYPEYGLNVTWDAEKFCSRFSKDVDSVIELKKKYPDRVYTTRYETIATRPIASTKNIYDFLGLEFAQSTAMFVYNKTHSQSWRAGRRFSTERVNSTDTSYKWRQTIPFEHASAFDNFCSEPFFKVGYLPAKSLKDLRNTSITLLAHTDVIF
ncbi:carbohydrate sulfotransferase 1, partial [Elysia marginata]